MESTDVLASIYLHLATDVGPELAKARGEISSFDAWMAGHAAATEAPTSLGATDGVTASMGALSAVDAESARVAASVKELEASMSESAIRAADKETAAALKSANSQIASSQRATLAVLRDYESQGRAAEVASAKQDAALAKVGKAAGLVTLGVAGIAVGTAAMAIKFQRDMETVRTQAGASQQEVDRMSTAILQLSRETGTGPDQLAQSLFHVESAGYRGAAALDMVRLAAQGAKVGNADLESTTQAVIGVMSSQIGGIHNATDAMSALNAIVGMGDVRMQGLVQAISTGVLPSFANFGLGIRDFAAAEATLTDNTTSADEAATRLRMTVSLIGAPSGAAAKALQAIGYSAADANAALSHYEELQKYGVHLTQLSADLRQPDGLLVALEDLKKHLEASGLTATEQGAVVARAFGGGKSGGTFETLYQELDRLKSKYDAFGSGVQKWGEDWKTTQQEAAFQAAKADASAQELGITLGTTLVPAADAIFQKTTDIASATSTWVQHNQDLAGGIEKLIEGGAGILAMSYAILKVRDAWLLVKTAAEAARIAELGALLLSPIGLATIAVGGLALAIKAENDAVDANGTGIDALAQKYYHGKETLAQLIEVEKEHGHAISGADILLAEAYRRETMRADAAKETTRALREQTQALKDLGAGMDAFNGKDFLGGKILGSIGGPKDTAGGSSDPTKATSGPAFDIQKAMTHATAMIDDWAIKVAADTKTFGAHSDQVAWDMRMLDKWRGTSESLNSEWTLLTNTSKDLKTAGLDPFTKGFQDAQKRLSDATSAIAQDYVKGIPVSTAQRQAFDEATASVRRYQAAQDAADGTTAAREKARQDKADAAQKAAWARIDKGLDAQAVKDHNLEVAAEKAAQALLGVQRAAIERSPVYQASVARYNATVNPSPQTAGLDPITIIENKIANLWNTSKSEADYEKSFGILSKQLDAAIKKYGDGVQKQFDKAQKDLENNPNIPGTDAWVKAMEALWKKVAASPAVVAGLANLGKAGGLATGGTFGGQNAAAGVAATNFQNQVNLGVVQAGQSANSEQAALATAKIVGDVGTQFSILSKLYAEGKVSLAALIPVQRENAALLTQQNQRLIVYDVATGDLVGAVTLAKQAYENGSGSLQTYVNLQKALNLQTDQTTNKTIAFDTAMGDATGAATLATQQYMAGTRSLTDTVPLVQAGNVATAAAAQKSWDLAFAAGDAATKTTMLAQSVSGLISRASTIAGAQNSVDQADLAILAANSNLMVAGITAETTQLTDLAGVITASSAVQTAVGNGTLARINDEIPIINDLYQITQATSPQALKVAQDQLGIDRLTQEKDAAVNAWQVRVAADGARTAIDKLNSDRATATAHSQVLMAQLVVQQDARQIALASQAISIDQLQGLDLIHSDLSGVSAFTDQVQNDLANLAQAQDQSRTDSIALAVAQGNENLVSAMGQALQAGDALQQAADTASMNSVSQSFDISIAGLKEQQAKDNIALQKLNAKSAASLQQLVDQGAEIRDSLDAIFGQGERMMQGLVSENISNLDPRQITSAAYAAQRASNKTSAA